jgi:hypothetical protein
MDGSRMPSTADARLPPEMPNLALNPVICVHQTGFFRVNLDDARIYGNHHLLMASIKDHADEGSSSRDVADNSPICIQALPIAIRVVNSEVINAPLYRRER